MRLFKAGLLLTTLIAITPLSFAKILPWNAQIPSSLEGFKGDAQDLATLTANHIFIYAHPTEKIKLPTFKSNHPQNAQFYSAAVVLPTPIAQVERVLKNYEQYVGLFPTLKSATTLESAGDIKQVKYQIHIPTPIPVLNFKETVIMQHQVGKNSIDTLIIDAPIPFAAGKLEWFALDNNKTLVTVTQWGDLNQPKGFLFSKILNALPEAKLGIPTGVNGFLLEALQQRFKKQSSLNLSLDQIPQPQLTAQQLSKISTLSQRSMQPVTFILPNYKLKDAKKTENLRFSTAFHYYPHASNKLQPWLAANASQQLFPRQIKRVHIQPIDPQNVDADFKVSVGLGVIQIPFHFKVRFKQMDALQTQYHAIGGDLKYVKGGMKLIPQTQGTLFQMTSSLKIDNQAPFLLRAMRSMPYHDILPAAGANTVYALKIHQKLK
ncbi:hypothetical protein A3K93_10325 [Acinetobacter sp. NCu2D-2]|uniref:hypothetical protein n=1 Tax=Acinetobacter sp. NCu2D-2 TaxID=1608473 RepID=UPI0007CDE51A|nr:hypothetical protein [Acinetobacter sp. NCu2D-2]ANF82547.1 hypothetical protein A3K93_10325 [Acinetobacter sp. NCu2D-2]